MNRIIEKLDRFLHLLDLEGVVIFQCLVYFGFALDGFYNLFFTVAPTTAVAGVITAPYYYIWLSMLWLGPIVCMVGKRCRGRNAYAGAILELSGDFATLGGLGAFVWAQAQNLYWGQGNITLLPVSCLVACVVLLVVRDVRRLMQIEWVVRWTQ